jgi:hypothetical protein
METQRVAWPSNVRNLTWPKTGITYSYENRGYIHPKKLERWLEKAFGGRDKADYRVGGAICAFSNVRCLANEGHLQQLRSLAVLLYSFHLPVFFYVLLTISLSKHLKTPKELIPSRALCEFFSCTQPCSYDLSQADEYDRQLLHGRIYIKAPREPTKVSYDGHSHAPNWHFTITRLCKDVPYPRAC